MEIFMKVSVVEGRRVGSFPNCTKVLVDVYRSTTTIPLALKAGAKCVIPTLTVAEARSVASSIRNSVTIGERYGFKIPGFDLNNSPFDVAAYDFQGRTAIITSTNGTRVLRRIQDSGEIFIASFVNFTATIDALKACDEVQIVLSGRPDGSADEDIRFGEALRSALLGEQVDVDKVISRVRRGRGTKRLIIIGGRRDISVSLTHDLADFPCKYEDGKIVKCS
ncbi:MAG: 2-phosphosulfolactate phosphatase [Thermoplasmataceae archaeon]